MESLSKRYLKFIFLLLPLTAHTFESKDFKLTAPLNRVEEAKMFGSDVMFLKEKNHGSGAIFVKFIEQNDIISDPGKFLLEKIESSKTTQPSQISSVTKTSFNGHDFLYVTFRDEKNNEEVFSGLFPKGQQKYLFILMKDRPETFENQKNELLSSLKSFHFK